VVIRPAPNVELWYRSGLPPHLPRSRLRDGKRMAR
jgi:hypothetical protein